MAAHDSRPTRGVITELLFRAYRAQDFTMTVTEAPHSVSPTFCRLRVRVPGMLSTVGFTPAMYLRIWFEKDGKAHQRAYTVIEPDIEADEFTLAVAMHDGVAAQWLGNAQVGHQRDVTLLGRGFQQSSLPHERYLAVADMASLPALGDVLAALDERGCDIVLEQQHDEDADVPVPTREQDTLTVVRRRDADTASTSILEALRALDISRHAVWCGVDSRTTRAVVQHCRAAGIRKPAIDALGYWNPKGMPQPSSMSA